MPRIISSDSHIVEPREVFDSLQRRFGDSAPHVERDEKRGDVIVVPGVSADDGVGQVVPVGRLGIAGRRLDDPETQRMVNGGYATIRPGITENELWSVMHETVIALNGNYCETRLLSAGQRTNPWFQETSGYAIGANELIAFDTAARSVEAVRSGQADVGFFAIDPLRGEGIAFTAPYVLTMYLFIAPKKLLAPHPHKPVTGHMTEPAAARH